MERCKDELDGEHYKVFAVTNPNGTVSEVLELNLDQCMLVAMRESKGVRRSVQAKLKERQPAAFAIPRTRAEALRLAADMDEQRQIAEAQRDEAIRTKAQIGNKREATAMATASAAKREAEKLREELGRNREFATVIAVENATRRTFPSNAYVELRREAKAHGVNPMDVPDKRYGMVKAWPAVAWKNAYGIELPAIFPAQTGGAH